MFSDSAACLNNHDIEAMVDYGAVERDGGDLHIGPSSLDLHVAAEQIKLEGGRAEPDVSSTVVDVADPESYPERKMLKDKDPLVLGPNEFCLARSQEVLDLSAAVMAFMDGRSSIGRLGLFVENAGLVDRGFEGTLTLELYNPTNNTIRVPAGTRVAQLSFFYQGGSEDDAYDGKYQGQHSTTSSRLYEDDEF